ncbi:DUF805 domain-containing protein [Demequina capsici]|uniref:DUF805 domain-containing protein n=1 Tax=Demequina capsici TaxID=3075620 RepID=A0AA96FBN9_9MICO|nr:DUF805 domain-containing protein [Demequina sp. PMTSA13]WNM27294.1 DUF805 domain-containing protein [Demequina sp. PMTSA13]
MLYVLLVTLGMSDSSLTAVGVILLAIIAIYGLFVLIPSLALAWRRYQDIGWGGALSIVGWFVPLLTFIVAFIPGNPGPNQFRPDPKG